MLLPTGPISSTPTCRACKGSGVDRETDLLCKTCDGSGELRAPKPLESLAGGALLLLACWLGWAAVVLA